MAIAVYIAGVAAVGGFHLVHEPGLDDRELLRTGGNVCDFKAAIAIGQHAGRGIPVDAHQRARQRIAGYAIAHDAVHGGSRTC